MSWLEKMAEKHSWARWIRDTKERRVGYWVMSYDESAGVYHMDFDTRRREDVDPRAIHVTGKGDTEWFLDDVRTGSPPEPGHCTAIDLYCWSKNNALAEALLIHHKTPLDPKILIYLAIGGLAVILLLSFYLR